MPLSSVLRSHINRERHFDGVTARGLTSASAGQDVWCGMIYLKTIDDACVRAFMYGNGVSGRELCFWEELCVSIMSDRG